MVDRNRYSIDEFSDDVRRILNAQGETTEAVWSLGPLLQRLARELEPIGDPDSEAPSGPLYTDPEGRFLLQLPRFGPEHVTPVHSHQGWGVLCLLSGSDRYTSWRRLDAGAEPRGAELALVQDHHLEPGDLAYWFEGPFNVHQQSAGAEGCTELVLHKAAGRRLLHFEAADDPRVWQGAPAPQRQSSGGASPPPIVERRAEGRLHDHVHDLLGRCINVDRLEDPPGCRIPITRWTASTSSSQSQRK